MLRSSLLSLVAGAVALGSLATAAQAGGYGYGYGYDKHYASYKFVCHFDRFKVKVGHDYYGNPIFKWKKKKVCEKVWY